MSVDWKIDVRQARITPRKNCLVEERCVREIKKSVYPRVKSFIPDLIQPIFQAKKFSWLPDRWLESYTHSPAQILVLALASKFCCMARHEKSWEIMWMLSKLFFAWKNVSSPSVFNRLSIGLTNVCISRTQRSQWMLQVFERISRFWSWTRLDCWTRYL